MSGPQLENGHVRIANELLEAILRGGFSQHEQSVIFTVIRKTYGFNKKEDDMSAAQIGTMCGVARQHVTTALNALAARNVINKRPGQFGMIIGLQKDHRKWISKAELKARGDSPESGLVQNLDMSIIRTGGSPESGQVDSPESGHTKDNLPKDNHQKTNSCAPQADRDQVGTPPASQKGRAKTGLTADLAERFERFYAAYPLKKSRGTAEKAFGKLAPDDELLQAMLVNIDEREASGTWVDPKYIPYPASWLNAKGWMDEVQAEYAPAEREVIEVFNELLGDQMGEVSATVFVSARAALIREFLGFQAKPDLARRFFAWFRDTGEAPPRSGLDWLISRKVYGDAIQGRYSRKAA